MAKNKITIKPQPGPQWDFLATEADICIFGGSAGGGKAQPLSEPVLTPFGFRPMGSIKVGSKVVSAHGRPAEVIQIFPQGVQPVYKVTFIDGAEVRCTKDHLWLASEARKRGKLEHRHGWRVYTTESLIEELSKGKNMLTPLCGPVQFTRRRAGGVIKPYTLGAILGDGCTVSDMITIDGADEEIFEHIRQEGYTLKEYREGTGRNSRCFGFQNFSKERRWLSNMKLKCRSYEKYIPEGYKYAGLEDRYSLIQGLMDTDGYADTRGHCAFCSTSKRLAEDMQWLIRSIGGKATITEKSPVCVFPDGSRKTCKTAYEVYIQTPDNEKLFSLERKKARCRGKQFNGGNSELKRRIISIEPCGEEECQCIRVDEPDGLYVTKDFVVTHNTHGLLLTPLMYKGVQGFNCTIFRRTFKQVFSPGGLWDTAQSIYGLIPNAQMKKVNTSWEFNDNDGLPISKVTFAHIENYSGVDDWQGSQLCEIGFDELTHFDEATFFYMMSRNRSTCGVKPFIRATCNPDADSWVAKFIEWWIDQDTGYPIPERSGKIRWFVRRDGIINWADTKEELWERFDLKTEEEKDEPRSVTFIMSSIYDNKELLKVNPQYLASLKSLPEVERERLLMGNWKIKPAAGMYFKRTQVQVLLDLPSDLELYCRAWDIAATADKESGDPDYTAGALLGLRKDKSVVVMDVINKRLPAAEVEKLIYNTAVSDRKKYGLKCKIRIPQDPGAAGKILAQNFIKMLSGFPVKAYPVSGSKEQRATPFAAQWQVGNVYVLAADWNEMFFNQLESFPQGAHDDMVDASSDAFNELAKPTFSLRNML